MKTQAEVIATLLPTMDAAIAETAALKDAADSVYVVCFESDLTPFRNDPIGGRVAIVGGEILTAPQSQARSTALYLNNKARRVDHGLTVIVMNANQWAVQRGKHLAEQRAVLSNLINKGI